jgi:two-component system response regulator (stage 0 sporulation protein F)
VTACDSSRPTVLLVEDDREFRSMLSSSLRRDGYAVVEAANGDQAFELLGPGVLSGQRRRLPDLVVCDVRLPYFSGLEILEGLHLVRPAIPVILMTAFGDSWVHEAARRLGALRTLDKPFGLDVLRAAVRKGLASRGR